MEDKLWKILLFVFIGIAISIPVAAKVGEMRINNFIEERYRAFINKYPQWESVWMEEELGELIIVKVDEGVKEGIKELLKDEGMRFFFTIDGEKAFNTLHGKLQNLDRLSDYYSYRKGGYRIADPDTTYARILRQKQRSRKLKRGLFCNGRTSALASAYALIFLDTTFEIVAMRGPKNHLNHVVFAKDGVALSDDSKEPISWYRAKFDSVYFLKRVK